MKQNIFLYSLALSALVPSELLLSSSFCFIEGVMNVKLGLVVDLLNKFIPSIIAAVITVRKEQVYYRATRMHSADYAVAGCPPVCHTAVLSVNGYTYP